MTIEEYHVIANLKLVPLRFFREEEKAKRAYKRQAPEVKATTQVVKYVIEVE